MLETLGNKPGEQNGRNSADPSPVGKDESSDDLSKRGHLLHRLFVLPLLACCTLSPTRLAAPDNCL